MSKITETSDSEAISRNRNIDLAWCQLLVILSHKYMTYCPKIAVNNTILVEVFETFKLSISRRILGWNNIYQQQPLSTSSSDPLPMIPSGGPTSHRPSNSLWPGLSISLVKHSWEAMYKINAVAGVYHAVYFDNIWMKKLHPNCHFASEKLECNHSYPPFGRQYGNTYISDFRSIHQCPWPTKSNLNTSLRNDNTISPPHKRTSFWSYVPKARIISRFIETTYYQTYRWWSHWKNAYSELSDQSLSMFEKD